MAVVSLGVHSRVLGVHEAGVWLCLLWPSCIWATLVCIMLLQPPTAAAATGCWLLVVSAFIGQPGEGQPGEG